MSKIIYSFIILCFFSCSNKYELRVEPEAGIPQKYYLKINSTISFPQSATIQEIDFEKDKIEVIKIKFIPNAKAWQVNNSSDNSYGQMGIVVTIVKKPYFFESEEIVFQSYVNNFWNPEISNVPQSKLNKIRLINEDLDSGLGNRIYNNYSNYGSYKNPLFPKSIFNNDDYNFHNCLIKKFNAYTTMIDGNPVGIITRTNISILISNEESKLHQGDLSKCAILFPANLARMQELKSYLDL